LPSHWFDSPPAALPDPVAIGILVATVIALLRFRVDAFKLMLAGAVLGIVRSRLPDIPGFKIAEQIIACTTA
jgi:hypothetical protein